MSAKHPLLDAGNSIYELCKTSEAFSELAVLVTAEISYIMAFEAVNTTVNALLEIFSLRPLKNTSFQQHFKNEMTARICHSPMKKKSCLELEFRSFL